MVDRIPEGLRLPWPWLVAGVIWGALLTLGGIWWNALPPANPIAIVGHSSEWVAPDRWRVETRVRIDSECRVAVTRRFDRDGERIRQPATSYMHPTRPGDLPFLVTARPGSASVWYEYEIGPEMVGTDYLLSVDAWRCDNGFSGEVGRWTIKVGPRP